MINNSGPYSVLNRALREKLTHHGAEHLSDTELITLFLNSRASCEERNTLTTQVLKILDRSSLKLHIDELLKIRGLSKTSAYQLTATFELMRRRIKPAGNQIRCAEDTLSHLHHYADRKQEHFFVLSLNGAHEIIAVRCISVGLLDSAPVHPREVFADPITDRAAAIIVAHNHPSGSLEISTADITVTSTLMDAGKILGIRVLDHIIFSQRGHVSLMERGFLNRERSSDAVRPHRDQGILGFHGDP